MAASKAKTGRPLCRAALAAQKHHCFLDLTGASLFPAQDAAIKVVKGRGR